MPDLTDEQLAILRLVRDKGGITLAGNREYFEILKFKDDCWLMVSGDTMTAEESANQIDDLQALNAISAKVRCRMGLNSPDQNEVSCCEILTWLKTNPFW